MRTLAVLGVPATGRPVSFVRATGRACSVKIWSTAAGSITRYTQYEPPDVQPSAATVWPAVNVV